MGEAYHHVNDAWPVPQNELPALTDAEAISAFRRIYRKAMGRPWTKPVKITTGRRYNWPRRGVFFINPSRGWWCLVHDVSHWCSFRLHPGAKAHGPQHHFLEKSLIEYVVASGFLTGKLKRPERPAKKADPIEKRYSRIVERERRWQARQRRAENALRKLKRQRTYYEKRQEAATVH